MPGLHAAPAGPPSRDEEARRDRPARGGLARARLRLIRSGLEAVAASAGRTGPGRPKTGGIGPALLAGCALACALAAFAAPEGAKEVLRALVFAGRPRPAPTGPFAVGSATFRIAAGDEAPAVPVTLYYPGARPSSAASRFAEIRGALVHPTRARSRPGAPPAPSGAGFPLLVYFPSWFSGRHENSFTLANLASLGFVVASLDDIDRLPPLRGPDAAAQGAGIDAASEQAFAASRVLAGRRVALEARIGSAVVSGILASGTWGPRIDAGRIGALGFSFGGGVAAAMGHADPRIRAVVNFDGSLFGAVAGTGLHLPSLTLIAGDSFPTPQDLVQPDLAARFEAILDRDAIAHQAVQDTRPDSWTLVVDQATHLDFSDRLVMPAFADRRGPGAIDRLRTWADINGVVATFLDVVLRDASQDATRDASGHAALDWPDAAGFRTLEAVRYGEGAPAGPHP